MYISYYRIVSCDLLMVLWCVRMGIGECVVFAKFQQIKTMNNWSIWLRTFRNSIYLVRIICCNNGFVCWTGNRHHAWDSVCVWLVIRVFGVYVSSWLARGIVCDSVVIHSVVYTFYILYIDRVFVLYTWDIGFSGKMNKFVFVFCVCELMSSY